MIEARAAQAVFADSGPIKGLDDEAPEERENRHD